MLFAIVFFNDSFANIVTITFTALIIIELLNIYTEVCSVRIDNSLPGYEAELEDDCFVTPHLYCLLPKHRTSKTVLRR